MMIVPNEESESVYQAVTHYIHSFIPRDNSDSDFK